MNELDVAEPWLLDAACRGQDPTGTIFFPTISERTGRARQRRRPEYDEARAICAKCPVLRECLEEELSFGSYQQHGMRGGLEPWERTKMISHPRRGWRQP